MIDPKSSFEKTHGKKENSGYPNKWQENFETYLDGWIAGYNYCIIVKELEKDVRDLSDLQRGQ